MAIRRYRRLRRYPVKGRRRRGFRRRRLFRRRKTPGVVYTKITVVHTIDVPRNSPYMSPGEFNVSDLLELEKYREIFERVQFTKVRVRVIPEFNISDTHEERSPLYCIFPWHSPAVLSDTFNKYLTNDKAKVYRQTQKGTMTFIPNTIVYSMAAGGNTASTIRWKPVIERLDGSGKTTIFTGCVAFQGHADMSEAKPASFNLIWDFYVKLSNLNTYNGGS
ncbi:coat protein [army ant associated cyclovirus 8 P1A-reste_2]|uniref:Coat protein n=1 Tax=army ant associated cyclovirus 8 P1A-reste_2 TaxID=3070167 RepID=A0AA47KVZ3_9CIRC|nr:coat protein [Army ant associated cyclovirus 8]WBG01485.1 coat protein [Army ant associated cyclovirus 8]